MCRPLLASLVLTLSIFPSAAQVRHPVPATKGSLSGGDWFPHVFSKLAPLEGWIAILSPQDIVRERFDSDQAFQRAKQDTYVIPRFCFQFFRIAPDDFGRLIMTIRSYRGTVVWSLYNNCVGAFVHEPGFISLAGSLDPEELMNKMAELKRNPPKPDPEFVKKAIDDIPRFCQYLESQLKLSDRSPLDFDTRWLTRESLSRHPDTFDDFFEPGDHMPVLRGGAQIDRDRSSGHDPSFGVGGSEMSDLLQELGANLDSPKSSESSAPEYPLLSRLDDITSGAWYAPTEVNRFRAEIERAQTIVKSPSSVRALDKLYRIARWAEKFESGIAFNGE